MPNIATWHYRGGLSDAPRVIYGDDGTPYIYGEDANGNPVVLDSDSAQPWWGNTLNLGIQTAGDIFARRNYGGGYVPQNYYNGGAGVNVNANSQGVGAGLNISNNMLLIGGIILAVFLLGKRR